MKEKIAWVTDTSAMLDEEFIVKNNIYVVPIVVILDEGPLRESVDISLEEFYVKLRTSKNSTTSQPVIGESVNLYKRLKSEGYTCAIAVHPSKKLSNTLESAYTAAKLADFKVYPIDSKNISYPMKKLIEYGKQLETEDTSVETIVQKMESMADQFVLTGIPYNLTQLQKSGRVPGIAAFLGNLLQLKLILSFEGGLVLLKNKVRTMKKAKNYLIDFLNKDLKRFLIDEVAIVHCNNEEEAEIWKGELQHLYPSIKFLIYPFSSAIAVHAGEGTIGLSWLRK